MEGPCGREEGGNTIGPNRPHWPLKKVTEGHFKGLWREEGLGAWRPGSEGGRAGWGGGAGLLRLKEEVGWGPGHLIQEDQNN